MHDNQYDYQMSLYDNPIAQYDNQMSLYDNPIAQYDNQIARYDNWFKPCMTFGMTIRLSYRGQNDSFKTK